MCILTLLKNETICPGTFTILSCLSKSCKVNIMFNCSELDARDVASPNWFWICLFKFDCSILYASEYHKPSQGFLLLGRKDRNNKIGKDWLLGIKGLVV